MSAHAMGPSVLVACEYSGRVRQALRDRGLDAWSCDLLDAEDGSPHHIKADVLSLLRMGWDALICFPPCTYLTNSGVRWLKNNPQRQEARRQAVEFVRALWEAPIRLKGMENPVGHLSTAFRKPDQIIQPYHFGHLERKTTCLWLDGLPPLQATDDRTSQALALPASQRDRVHWMPPGVDRWKERSRTYLGIARAMGDQWGPVIAKAAGGEP